MDNHNHSADYFLNRPKSASLKDIVSYEFGALYNVGRLGVKDAVDASSRFNTWIQDASEKKYSSIIDNLEKTYVGRKVAKPIDALVTAIVDATEVNTSIGAGLLTSLVANYFGTNYYASMHHDQQSILNMSYVIESSVNTAFSIFAFLYVERKKGVKFGRSVLNLAEVGAVMFCLSYFGYKGIRDGFSTTYKNMFDTSYGASTTIAQIGLTAPFFVTGKWFLKMAEDIKRDYIEDLSHAGRLALVKTIAGKDMVVTAVRNGVRKTNRGLRFVSAIGRLRKKPENNIDNRLEDNITENKLE